MGEGEVKQQKKKEKEENRESLCPLLPLKPRYWVDVISTSDLVPTLKLFTICIIFSFARIVSRTACYLLLVC